jgi:hypothetical protein
VVVSHDLAWIILGNPRIDSYIGPGIFFVHVVDISPDLKKSKEDTHGKPEMTLARLTLFRLTAWVVAATRTAIGYSLHFSTSC